MFDFIAKGGPIMYLLLPCSLYGGYIVIQKLLFFRLNKYNRSLFIEQLKTQLMSVGKQTTIQELRVQNKTVPRIVAMAIELSDQPMETIQDGIQDITTREMPELDRNMPILSSITTIAPILGLLGTVIGLMDIFNVISGGGIGDAQALSSGIAQALITTVTGLSIAIPFIVLANIISQKSDVFMLNLEHTASDIVSFCKSHQEIRP